MSSWNKFCFTGGYFVGEYTLTSASDYRLTRAVTQANVSLPGSSKLYGLWPAIWAMGNLGRAGYGASLDGTWPYTYVNHFPSTTFSPVG